MADYFWEGVPEGVTSPLLGTVLLFATGMDACVSSWMSLHDPLNTAFLLPDARWCLGDTSTNECKGG